MLTNITAFVKRFAEIGVTRLGPYFPIGYGGEFASLSNGKEVRQIRADHASSHFTMRELRRDAFSQASPALSAHNPAL
ncbi:MAG TPA: hypothetical protein VK731_06580, partial [Candidatus Cybelea sp.]|nr:hypothetical protein [Candidatus Cybelea sp.]